MKNIFIVSCLVFTCYGLSAQNGQESIAYTRDSVRHVNRSCRYPGNMAGLLADVHRKLDLPCSAKKEELHGKVFLRVTIAEDGRAVEPKVMKGVREDIDMAVLEMSKKLQRFEPATMDGRAVKTSILIPVTF